MEVIIDDQNNAYKETGFGWSTATGGGGYAGAVRRRAGADASSASWTWGGLHADMYTVSVTWTSDPGNATDATYRLFIDGVLVGTYVLNQTVAPSGPTYNDTVFQILVSETPVPGGGGLRVELSGTADGYVVADAARIASSTDEFFFLESGDRLLL